MVVCRGEAATVSYDDFVECGSEEDTTALTH